MDIQIDLCPEKGMKINMNVSEFNYNLPEELIAQVEQVIKENEEESND